ncbi:TolC family protein [Paucihalobacter ruber]|uniref:TolC family protein n=1 Tax=Paucihalobacter ruber TaxID=2567861 RepID=UPI001FE2C503|nr:TolC family protein [Paucihalobacter ruber]
MKHLLIIGVLVLTTYISYSQNTINLETCYEGLNANYPLVKQHIILNHQNETELSAIKTQALPQLKLNAQATYQSDVTEVPIPNTGIEPLNNDQYRATLTANQLIYAGGKIKASQDLQNTINERKKQEVTVSLYQLKQRVNQLYFSILLMDDYAKLLGLRKAQLTSKLNEVKSGIENGLLLPTSDKVIEAELLKILQQIQEANNNKSKLINSLADFTGISIQMETQFEKPFLSIDDNSNLLRPEIGLFDLQKEEIEQQQNIVSKSLWPELKGFATGGYGNPGLNMLENNFRSFYIIGLNINWNVFDWNTNKKQRQVLDYNKELIKNQEEVFRLTNNIALNEQYKEIETLKSSIAIDQQLISLQKEVVNTYESQLTYGVITTSEYITELTKLYETENLYNQHNTQLQLAKANYKTIKGDIK